MNTLSQLPKSLLPVVFPALEEHPIPSTVEELAADRVRHWQSFNSVVAIAAAGVIFLLVGMAVFLV